MNGETNRGLRLERFSAAQHVASACSSLTFEVDSAGSNVIETRHVVEEASHVAYRTPPDIEGVHGMAFGDGNGASPACLTDQIDDRSRPTGQ